MNLQEISSPGPRRGRPFFRTAVIFCCLFSAVFAVLAAWNLRKKSADQLLIEGETAASRRDYGVAISRAEELVRTDPESATGWRLLSESTGRSGERDRSIEALETLSRLEPADAGELGVRLGRQWMLENRVLEAVRALQIAERANARPQEIFRMQAQIAGMMGRPREVVRCIIELIKRGAFTREDLVVASSANPIAADAGRLSQIIEVDPEARLQMLAYVMHYITLNQMEDAKRLLLEITSARPHDSEAQGLLGEVYADSEPERFLEWHTRLPLQADDDSRVWLARGKWLRKQGATDSAIRCLHEAFSREPELLPANFLLGQVLSSQGELVLGEEFMERGKRLQRIIDWSGRMGDRRASDWVPPMIAELEATGRLWEAWGWHRVLEQSTPRVATSRSTARQQLLERLSVDLPRTHPDFLPGKDFDWNRFPLPRWSDYTSFTSAVAGGPAATAPMAIRFTDQVEAAGLDFRFVNSAIQPEGRKIFETMGAGVAVLDYDRDGWPDLYFPQGSTSPTDPSVGPSDAIYRNQSGKRYSNVTTAAGIQETTYSQGVAAGDFDNDGFPDVYVANLGRNCLYRNNGDGTFSDVTHEAGLNQGLWTVSCAIADLNGDGFPELFDVNYVEGPQLFTGTCYDQNGRAGVCRPVVFDPSTDTVSLNQGDGRFLEQQGECGLDLPQGMGLGLVVADFNDDRRLDVFVANDMTANYLLINEQVGPDQPLRFRDEAFLRGVALDQNGFAQACMGVACADVNGDGLPDLFITNFAREYDTLYRSHPGGFYQDDTQVAGLREPSFDPLGFGTQFFDADHDGRHDLAVVNGHLEEIPNEPFRMKAQFYRGRSDGRFEELFAEPAGSLFDKPRLGRGMALLDWNRDGRVDFVASDLDGPILLAENQTRTSASRLRLRLVGTESSRDAIGAKIRIRVSAADDRISQLTAGDGYESSNERMVDVGLGDCPQIDEVEITWPSGRRETRTNLRTDSEWLVIEGSDTWWSMTSWRD